MRPLPGPTRLDPRFPGRLLALLVLMAASTACTDANQPAVLARRNLIVIVVDTLRADHLGFHGSDRDTSPFLDRIAAEGVVFDRAVSNSSFTRESISVLFSGRLPSLSGSMGWNAAPSNQFATLGEVYSRAGYRTGFFTTTIMFGNRRFTRGFHVVDTLVEKAGISGMSHDLTDRALDFVRQSSEDEFMLYVHYFDPHGPYDPPEELMRRFTDTVHPEPVGLYTQLRPELDRYLGEGFGPGEARYEDQQLRYDAEIVDVDDAIRALFDGLDALGVADDTLVVLTSDHGEEFLDHGYIEHAWTLYDESIHVPLVFWAPGALEPSRVAEPASLADVLPSVVALMGMPDNGRTYDGRALFDARGQSSRVTAPIVSELLVHHRNVMRAVTLGEWKYIQARQFLTPEGRTQLVQRGEGRAQKQLESVPFDPWSPIVREELFNLRDDPRETTNLSLAEPARLAQMRAVLADFEARARELAPAQQGTAEELSQDEEMAERIRAIGY